mmetsp:Transcript_5705/g.9727  ORF Transcript_5705/g.9727 Transcript_5705/m.9727 type:complete len:93 (-) Transcript_5705:99-377(-)
MQGRSRKKLIVWCDDQWSKNKIYALECPRPWQALCIQEWHPQLWFAAMIGICSPLPNLAPARKRSSTCMDFELNIRIYDDYDATELTESQRS